MRKPETLGGRNIEGESCSKGKPEMNESMGKILIFPDKEEREQNEALEKVAKRVVCIVRNLGLTADDRERLDEFKARFRRETAEMGWKYGSKGGIKMNEAERRRELDELDELDELEGAKGD